MLQIKAIPLLYHNLLLYDLSHLYFSKKMCWHPVYSVASWVLQEVKIETCWWPQHSVADLVHFLAFLCEALLCGRQHAIYNSGTCTGLYEIQRSGKRSGCQAKPTKPLMAKTSVVTKSMYEKSLRKVWSMYWGIKGKRCYNCLSSEWWTLYVLRTWRLKSVSRTVLAEDVAQLEPMHPASHTVWYRIPGDAITGNGEWHKVYIWISRWISESVPLPPRGTKNDFTLKNNGWNLKITQLKSKRSA